MKQLFILILSLFCFSCSDLFLTEIPCEFDEPQYTFEADIKPIIDQYCISCHRSDYQSGDLDLSEYNEFNISKYFVPGDTTQGQLLNYIQNINDPMPPSGLMDIEKINIIKTWILECAIEN